MYAYTVTLGRNVPNQADASQVRTFPSLAAKQVPMSDAHWATFVDEVAEHFADLIADWETDENHPFIEIHRGKGVWDSIEEESAKVSMLSEGIMNKREYDRFIAFLENLAVKYNQDAIAFTFGTSFLIGQRAQQQQGSHAACNHPAGDSGV